MGTGISPHVNVLRQNAIMLAEQKRMHGLLVELRENLPSQIARDVRDEIDTFSQEQGNITLTTLQSFQSTLLDKIDGLNGVGSSSNATGAGGVVVVPPKNTQQIQWSDRSFHHLPENYNIELSVYMRSLVDRERKKRFSELSVFQDLMPIKKINK